MSDSYVSLLYGKNARVSQSMSLKPQNGESVFYNLHLLCQKCSLKAKKGGLNFCETSTCKIFWREHTSPYSIWHYVLFWISVLVFPKISAAIAEFSFWRDGQKKGKEGKGPGMIWAIFDLYIYQFLKTVIANHCWWPSTICNESNFQPSCDSYDFLASSSTLPSCFLSIFTIFACSRL